MGPQWGIDLGGTNIEGIALADAASTTALCRMRLPTEMGGGYYHVLGQVHKLVEVMAAELGVRPASIGVGMPGAVDPITKTLKSSGHEALDGKPVQRDLETYLGIPVRIANDANCFALAEARHGAAAESCPGAKCVLGVVIGTGVGAGLVINGRVYPGRQGIAGEWGHTPLLDEHDPCPCGRVGCVETVISGPALERFYEARAGRSLPLPQIVTRAELGDGDAAATVDRLVYNFARGLGAVINVLDPDCVVIGGGVGQVDALYREGAELVRRFVFNPRLDTLLLRPKLGDAAGVYGAAML